ncbi:MalY/PatB family protein [Paenibacillus beijingensis]|uniref:cysteine-S-conjugate beta-lyase n=1 Tax=Paenibacillus beijingensis TaxID=1126833 RepID=A0A0D5NIX2_9BACL|nr:MalY/PatB family protein [Paenibacillus beijingensis]AJY75065.1 aminotransferase class I and II [Paenibacillus beijingensis]
MNNIKHNFDEVIELRGTDSKKHNLYPPDVIPMWIADTDFKCAQPIVDVLVDRAAHGVYGYTTSADNFNLSVQRWLKKRFDWDIDTAWVEYAPAVVAGLVNAIQAFTRQGDKVLIQSPVYHPFHHIIANNGRTKVQNNLLLNSGRYEIDFEDLERKLKDPQTKLMLLCNPHNPVGRVYTREELMRIGELCLQHGVIVVSDEIHSDIVYEGHRHIPFPTLSEEIRNNCIVCLNPSKTFNTPGLRTAAIVIPNEDLRQAYHETIIANKADGRTIFGTLAFETAYNECDYYADQLVEYLAENVRFMMDYFERNIPNIKVIKPEATYLMWLDCRQLGMEQKELRTFMLERAKVGLHDGTIFGAEGTGFLRMNIGCRKAVLKEALVRIERAVNALNL